MSTQVKPSAMDKQASIQHRAGIQNQDKDSETGDF